MKTQCPKCGQVWNIEADEQDQSIECFYCKTKFKAALYSGNESIEVPPVPYQPPKPKESVEFIQCPGGIWYFLGAVVGIIGIIAGLAQINRGGLATLISAAFFWLIATAIGGVLNRLERIAYHTEKLREEVKTKNPG